MVALGGGYLEVGYMRIDFGLKYKSNSKDLKHDQASKEPNDTSR